MLFNREKMSEKMLTSQAFEKSWNIARKMTSLLREEKEEVGFFDRNYWNRQNKKLQQLKARNFKKELPT